MTAPKRKKHNIPIKKKWRERISIGMIALFAWIMGFIIGAIFGGIGSV